MAFNPVLSNSAILNENFSLTNSGRNTVPLREITQPLERVQRKGSVIFNPKNKKLYYSDGTTWLQVISSVNGNVQCISDADFDTSICTDTDPETNSDTIVMTTNNIVRLTITKEGDIIGTLTTSTTNVINDIVNITNEGDIINITNNNGDITNTTVNEGDIINTTNIEGDIVNIVNNDGDIVNIVNNEGDITNTVVNNGDITNTIVNTGDIINVTNEGNITNTINQGGDIINTTTIEGDITNTTYEGDIINTTTNGGDIINTTTIEGNITHTTNQGDIINTTIQGGDIINTTTIEGDITNVTNAGDITNTTTQGGDIINTTTIEGNITNTTNEGNITNTTQGGDIINTTNFEGDIINTTIDGDITNTSTNGGNIINTTNFNGDIINTTIEGDITNTTTEGDIINQTTTGSVTINAPSGSVNVEANDMQFDIVESLIFNANGDFCANFLLGLIKSAAVAFLVDTIENIIMSTVGGDICFNAPLGAIKNTSVSNLVTTTGDIVMCAGGATRGNVVTKAMAPGSVLTKAMAPGSVLTKALNNGDIENIAENDIILTAANNATINGEQGTYINGGGPTGVQLSGLPGGSPVLVQGGFGLPGVPGGPVSILGGPGDFTTLTLNNNGGPVNISGGNAGNLGPGGGPVNITGGSAASNSPGGPVNINGGPASFSSAGGPVNINGALPFSPGSPGAPVNLSATNAFINQTATGPMSAINLAATGDDNCGVNIEASGLNTKGVIIKAPIVKIDGNLCVTGTTTTVNSETVNVADNCIYLNDGYTVPAGMGGCIAINYLPTSNCATVAVGGFTAGVVAISNPTLAKTNAHTFLVGDLIQITGATNPSNNGLFEVLSDTGMLLTIRGVGTSGTTVDFVQNRFETDATVAGSICQVNIVTIGSSSAGNIVVQSGNNASDPAMVIPETVVLSVVGGLGISVNSLLDPAHPVVTNDGVITIIAGDGMNIDNLDPNFPVVTNNGVISVVGGVGIDIDNMDPNNPIVINDGVRDINGGPGIIIDDTDPNNPSIINNGVRDITGGSGINIDDTNPNNPIVINTGVISVVAGAGISVNNMDPQNPVISSDGFQKTRGTYHMFFPLNVNDGKFDVSFKVAPSDDPVLWNAPATLYEANNITVVSDGILEMSGATTSPTLVKIDWYINGDFIVDNDRRVEGLMRIYKNASEIPQSLRRFVQFYDTFDDGFFPMPERRYSEGQASGSFITSLANGDTIAMYGGLMRPELAGDVINRYLNCYCITITEL